MSRAELRGFLPHPTIRRRALFVAIAIAACVAGATAATARAETDNIYTWHDESDASITGFMSARSSSQDSGLIQFSDITGFSFTSPIASFTLADLEADGFLPIPVSQADGAFTGSPLDQLVNASNATPASLRVSVGAESGGLFNTCNFTTLTATIDSRGNWTVRAATFVPELTTLTLAFIGLPFTAGVVTVRRIARSFASA